MDILKEVLDFGNENLAYGLVGTFGIFLIKKVRDTAFLQVRHLGRQVSSVLRKKSRKLEEAAEAGVDKAAKFVEEFRDGMKEDNDK